MKRILASAIVLAAVAAFMVVAGGAGSSSNSTPTYKVELDNAFGLVKGADFKVAGVRAGKIDTIDLDPGCMKGQTAQCRALVTVDITLPGFGTFHPDAFCQSRPQSLIGEYFIDCTPGTQGKALKSGATIPVSRTQSTIPLDLLNDVMRMPYRERFSLIINELGAAVAGRSGDLAAALRRAVPALEQTDNLLNLLGNDSQTLQALTVNSDHVITELANNSKVIQRWIDESDRISTISATQDRSIADGIRQLPGFLEQLRPALADLSGATKANLPVLQNLNASAGTLNTLFHVLPSFAHASLPALRALGRAGVTGRVAVTAAAPTVRDLNTFARSTPELAQNLSIVLHDLDNRNRAVEPDSRSPQGRGYTGIEALLQYVFNQALAINTFNPLGHLLAVDLFVDPVCSPYADQQTIAQNLAKDGAQARRCYAWLGPNQPGVNETDPSNPSACVPDPGGAPPGQSGPSTTACKLQANPSSPASLPLASDRTGTSTTASTAPSTTASTASASTSPGSASSGGGSSGQAASASSTSGAAGASTGTSSTGTSSGGGGSSSGGQAQQLLNYLLAP